MGQHAHFGSLVFIPNPIGIITTLSPSPFIPCPPLTMRASRISALYDSDASVKSLTPQRKHRKLLKDGSSEVWPEDIERVFVQGPCPLPPRTRRPHPFSRPPRVLGIPLGNLLPWPQPLEEPVSRRISQQERRRSFKETGRKPHPGLAKHVEGRTRYIQFSLHTPNLTPFSSEYHLVAGGEELFLETALLPTVKAEDSPDAHLLTPAGLFDDHSPASDRSTGSATSPSLPRSLYSCSSPTLAATPELTLPHIHGIRPARPDDDARRIRSLSASDTHRSDPRRLSPLSSYWTCDLGRPSATHSSPNVPYTAIDQTLDFTPHYSPEPGLSDSPLLFTDSSLFPADPSPSSIGLTRFSLWAEGMPTLSLPVDALIPPTQPSQQPSQAVLRIRLHLPPIDVPSFPALHGFQGSITCTIQPTATVRCSTTIFVRGQCTSREGNLCTLMTTESSGNDQLGSVTLLLPDSPLSRSRWLDSSE